MYISTAIKKYPGIAVAEMEKTGMAFIGKHFVEVVEARFDPYRSVIGFHDIPAEEAVDLEDPLEALNRMLTEAPDDPVVITLDPETELRMLIQEQALDDQDHVPMTCSCKARHVEFAKSKGEKSDKDRGDEARSKARHKDPRCVGHIKVKQYRRATGKLVEDVVPA